MSPEKVDQQMKQSWSATTSIFLNWETFNQTREYRFPPNFDDGTEQEQEQEQQLMVNFKGIREQGEIGFYTNFFLLLLKSNPTTN